VRSVDPRDSGLDFSSAAASIVAETHHGGGEIDMGNMQELIVGSSGLSPSARVLVCRILEVALEVVKAGAPGNWNRDSNSPGALTTLASK
jgi:hypothetical protein